MTFIMEMPGKENIRTNTHKANALAMQNNYSTCEWRPEWLIELKATPTAPDVIPCDWLNPDAILIPRQVWEARRDYYVRRFGNCPAAVCQLGRRD